MVIQSTKMNRKIIQRVQDSTLKLQQSVFIEEKPLTVNKKEA